MGDLIIKPASSGNLKIQDQGGTERISLNTSGLTTFAANVALSDTMTGGTLASAVTFPAGHVIQTKFFHITDSEALNVAATPTMTESLMTGSITPKYSTSKILITMAGAWGQPAALNHWTQQIKRTISGTSTVLDVATNLGGRRGSTGIFTPQIQSSSSTQIFMNYVNTLDSPSTTSEITYTLTVGHYNGVDSDTIYFNRTQLDRATSYYDVRMTSSVLLQEIAQ